MEQALSESTTTRAMLKLSSLSPKSVLAEVVAMGQVHVWHSRVFVVCVLFMCLLVGVFVCVLV